MSHTVHAFNSDDALADYDATALAEQIRQRNISPEEVQKAAITRAQRINPALNAIVLERFDQPIQTNLDNNAIFAGVPTFIKDNVNIAGLPTRMGSRAIPSVSAKTNSPFVDQYLNLGMTCLGKSTLPEFGFSASTEFMFDEPTHNPWHIDYSSGASSGGSAALVASGVVPIAHANDGGGSIRIPAAVCGLVGLKPTRGRLVINPEQKALPINIICDGVVTRSVRDTANFYAGAERFYQNPKLAPIGLVQGPSTRRLRIGFATDSITDAVTDNETRATVENTAKLLAALGHHVEEIDLPISQQFPKDFAMYWGFLAFMVDTFGRQIIDPKFDASQLDNLSKGLSKMFRQQAWRSPAMLYRLGRAQKQYASFMKQYDVVLTPTLAHTTPQLGHLKPDQPFEQLFHRLQQYVCFTPLNNVAGSPAISLPMGHSQLGLPIGMHFSAAHGDEATLLALAFELEAAQPWRRIQDQ